MRSYLPAVQVGDGVVHGTVLDGSGLVDEKAGQLIQPGIHHLRRRAHGLLGSKGPPISWHQPL